MISPGEAQPALLLDIIALFCFKECSREDYMSLTRAQRSLLSLFDVMILLAVDWMFRGGGGEKLLPSLISFPKC